MRDVVTTLIAVLIALPLNVSTRRRAVAPSPVGMAKVQRVVEIVFENTDFTDAITQPFFNEIASATSFHCRTSGLPTTTACCGRSKRSSIREP